MWGSVSLYNYQDYPTLVTSHRKLDIPVMESQSLYANFKYVQGVPSPEGLSLDKLQVIDSLIGLYNAHRPPQEPPLTRADLADGLPDTDLKAVAEKVHRLQSEIKPSKPYQESWSAQAVAVDTSI